MQVPNDDLNNPKTAQSASSITRNLQIAQATVAGVDLGEIAVSSESSLEQQKDSVELPQEQKTAEEYLGQVDIDHMSKESAADTPTDQQIVESGEESQTASETLEAVNNKYIPSEPYEPTGNDPYPKRPPLLAPN